MVEPKADVTIIVELRSRDRDRLVSVVGEDGERASSIECKTTDRAGIDVVLCEDPLHRGTDAAPDVIGGLLLKEQRSIPDSSIVV